MLPQSADGRTPKRATSTRQVSSSTSSPPAKRVRFALPEADLAHAPPAAHHQDPVQPAPTGPEATQGPVSQALLEAQRQAALLTQRLAAARASTEGIGLYTHVAGPSRPPTQPGERARCGPPAFLPLQAGPQHDTAAPGSLAPDNPEVRRIYEELCAVLDREGRRSVDSSASVETIIRNLNARYGALHVPEYPPPNPTAEPADPLPRRHRWDQPFASALSPAQRPERRASVPSGSTFYEAERDPRRHLERTEQANREIEESFHRMWLSTYNGRTFTEQ